jgi:hypothetical protein
MLLDWLRSGCDEAAGAAWTVAVDATMVRAHQHAAGPAGSCLLTWTRRRCSPSLSAPARLGGGSE